MKKWLYILGGCLIGFLVKTKVDERTKSGPVVDWPGSLKRDDGDDHHSPTDDTSNTET